MNCFISLFCSDFELCASTRYVIFLFSLQNRLVFKCQLVYPQEKYISNSNCTEMCQNCQFKTFFIHYWLINLLQFLLFIALQIEIFSKFKIFCRHRKNISSHSFKTIKVNQNQFVISIKNFLWYEMSLIPAMWTLYYPLA